jgi:hypothetical protein
MSLFFYLNKCMHPSICKMTWAPFNGLYFATYDFSKKTLREGLGISSELTITMVGNSYAGLFYFRFVLHCQGSSLAAGTIASVATSPIDLVKTRLQVQRSNPAIFDYSGPIDAFQKILKREGFVALFDGVAARIMWLTPRLSIAVPTYELLKHYFVAKLQ